MIPDTKSGFQTLIREVSRRKKPISARNGGYSVQTESVQPSLTDLSILEQKNWIIFRLQAATWKGACEIMQKTFVIIIGPHAVGKMTVGQELAKITGLRLFHNHMSIELARKLFAPNEQEEFHSLIRAIRQKVLIYLQRIICPV